jgi:Spy/CpxP family protein refolding chaperone
MRVMLTRLGLAVLGCAAAIVCSAAVASADPPDPHQPDLPKNFCPGGQWDFGRLRVCDGEKYPDGSYWHQVDGRQRLGRADMELRLRRRQRQQHLSGTVTARWLQRGNSTRAARPARNLTAAGGGPAPTSRCINDTQKKRSSVAADSR